MAKVGGSDLNEAPVILASATFGISRWERWSLSVKTRRRSDRLVTGAMTVSEQTSSRGRSLAEEFIPKRGKMRSISGPTFFSHSVLTFEGRAGDIFANAANSSQIMPPRPRFEGRTHTHHSSKINQFETKAQSSIL